MAKSFCVSDLMTKKVISVTSQTPLIEAVNMLLRNKFNGLPVVDQEKKLVGILTEYDLILKGSSLHLPTFIKLIQQLDVYRNDRGLIKDNLQKILKMKVVDVMNQEPLFVSETTSINELADLFSSHHRVNPIPVVDGQKKLVGIISRFDLVKLFGVSSVSLNEASTLRETDENIARFLTDFQKKFILVSRFRTHYWFVFSILFVLVGFFIAFALILRLNSHYG